MCVCVCVCVREFWQVFIVLTGFVVDHGCSSLLISFCILGTRWQKKGPLFNQEFSNIKNLPNKQDSQKKTNKKHQ